MLVVALNPLLGTTDKHMYTGMRQDTVENTHAFLFLIMLFSCRLFPINCNYFDYCKSIDSALQRHYESANVKVCVEFHKTISLHITVNN